MLYTKIGLFRNVSDFRNLFRDGQSSHCILRVFWFVTLTVDGGATGRARDTCTPLVRVSHLIASELQVHVASESVTINGNIVILTLKYQ